MESIPKVIHYCWFGNGEKPASLEKYIASWKKYMPDYVIIEWNEHNFDVKMNQYVSEAYNHQKYAFVADYARLYVLYHYGGIYFDTDVEVKRSFDDLLNFGGVVGFENNERISTATLAFCSQNEWVRKWMDAYDERKFIVDGKMDMTTNVDIFTDILVKRNLKLNNEKQMLAHNLIVLPKDYFSPYSYGEKTLQATENTYAVHWFEATWVSGMKKVKLQMIKGFKHVFGENTYEKVRGMVNNTVGGHS